MRMLLISRQNKPPSHLVADQLGGVVVRGDEVRPHRLPHRSRVFRLSCRLHTPKKTTQQTRLNHPSTPPPPKKKKTTQQPPQHPRSRPFAGAVHASQLHAVLASAARPGADFGHVQPKGRADRLGGGGQATSDLWWWL